MSKLSVKTMCDVFDQLKNTECEVADLTLDNINFEDNNISLSQAKNMLKAYKNPTTTLPQYMFEFADWWGKYDGDINKIKLEYVPRETKSENEYTISELIDFYFKLLDSINNITVPQYIINAYQGDYFGIPTYLVDFDKEFSNYLNSEAEEPEINTARTYFGLKPLTGGELFIKDNDKHPSKRFVFTSAQNNTDVHSKFLDALKVYAKYNNAELMIGRFTYNKNGFQNDEKDDDELHYDAKIMPYVSDNQIDISEKLTWCGDVNILPTAKNPLHGFENYTGLKSTIIPHAKISLLSVPTPKNEECKMLYSTGCCTQRNYIQKKAGQLAQKAHNYGALVVEILDDGTFFARQIETDESGEFYDLDKLYKPDGTIHKAYNAINSIFNPTDKYADYKPPLAINWGDIHAEKSDEQVLRGCLVMRDELKPENQFFHDLSDFSSRNHHNRKSGHFLAKNQEETVLNDLLTVANFLTKFTHNSIESHVVESNHDLALQLWLDDASYNYRTDMVNAETFLALQLHIYKELGKGNEVNILEHALTDHLYNTEELGAFEYENLIFYNVDDSIVHAGIEFGFHGHIGCNGARGNPNQFNKLNRKVNTGHTHTSGIIGNVYTAGVMGSLDMGYNTGPSSWSHSHILTYANGMRAIITQKMVDNEWAYRA